MESILNQSWLIQHPIAHRGYHWEEGIDENSWEAFVLAVEKKIPLECDLHLSRDGEVFIHHDYSLKRMTGQDINIGAVNSSELKELRTHQSQHGIVALDELLEMVQGRVPLVLEVKRSLRTPDLERGILEKLANYKGDYSLQSFNPKTLVYLRNHQKDSIIGLLSGEQSLNHLFLPTRILLQSMTFVSLIKPDYIGFEWTGLHKRAPQEMRRVRDIPLISWTVNDKKSLGVSRLLADNIIYENLTPKDLE